MQEGGTMKAVKLALQALLFTGIVFTLSQGRALAQSKTGTTIGQFLLIEPSARVAGMGNAGVTTFGEIQAAYFNPGALGHLDESGVQFTHSQWLAGISYNYAAAGVRIGAANTLLLTFTSLNSGEIDVRTVENPQGTGERYTVADVAVGLGFSRRVSDRFSAGLHVKYIQESIWHSSMSAMAVDFGVLYRLPFRAYIGASLSNFGSKSGFDGRDLRIRYDQDPDQFGDNSNLPAALETESFALPIFFRVGMGFAVLDAPNNRMLVVVDAFHPSDNEESMSLGMEWTLLNLISLRAGYQHLFLDDSEVGLTLGTGLRYRVSGMGLRFDYAWNEYGLLGDAQRFSLGLAF
jgi:hypothetical protein